MSSSDDKDKKRNPLSDLDWDQALSEWEENTFLPSMAGERPPSSRPPPSARPSARPTPTPGSADDDATTGVAEVSALELLALVDEAAAKEDGEAVPQEGDGLVELVPVVERDVAADPRFAEASVTGLEVETGSIGSEGLEVVEAKDYERALPPEELEPLEGSPDLLLDDDGHDDGLEITKTHSVDAHEVTAAEDDDDAHATGPALLAPQPRRFDPDSETSVLSSDELQAAARARGVDLPGFDDGDRTQRRGRTPALRAVPRGLGHGWEDESPARTWISPDLLTKLADRAVWLEDEARAGREDIRGRALLSVSEILALVGSRGAAARAEEARALLPTSTLAWQQARGTTPLDDPDEQVAELDAQAAASLPIEARAHAALLAADRVKGRGLEERARRWAVAAQIAPMDPRGRAALAAHALATGTVESPALAPSGEASLRSLDVAAATASYLRGGEGHGKAHAFSGNEALRQARRALERGDVVAAASALESLVHAPELTAAARWLAASLAQGRAPGREAAAQHLKELAAQGDDVARRALAARALEAGDEGALSALLARGGQGFSATEVPLLLALGGAETVGSSLLADATAAAAVSTAPRDAARPLVAALSATVSLRASSAEALLAHTERTAGSAATQAQVTLGRLLAAAAPPADVLAAAEHLASMDSRDTGEDGPSEHGADEARAMGRALCLEATAAAGTDLPHVLEGWSEGDVPMAERERAAGLAAEHAGDTAAAAGAYRRAAVADPQHLGTLRAAAQLDETFPLAEALLSMGNPRGPAGALALVEAVARGAGGPQTLDRLTEAQVAAPDLPLPAFVAAREAAATQDVPALLRVLEDRRARAGSPVEAALDAVRQALLVAETEPTRARELLEEARKVRPHDVALRELAEQLGSAVGSDTSPADLEREGARWRQDRAASAQGAARGRLHLEAAYALERAGDLEAALRASEEALRQAEAHGGSQALPRAVIARLEMRSGAVAKTMEAPLALARSAPGQGDPRARRDALRHLAELDGVGRGDEGSALMWHRALLELDPEALPSLRAVEQSLLQAGQSSDLEPVAVSLARALTGIDEPEALAHAELALRLGLRGEGSDWETTAPLVDLASSRPMATATLLRLRHAHARAKGDDEVYLDATATLLDRASRPLDIAYLCLRAAEASVRLGNLEDALPLLERAKNEDAGDVVTWGLLADLRRQLGDLRGTAEAFESMARSSTVTEHQLSAWYDAARTWLDDVGDPERGVAALEHAAAIDVAHGDVFPRLRELYLSRRADAELAVLLERHIPTLTDAAVRIEAEVDRARALTRLGDTPTARGVLEAALGPHPDHPAALGAFAELCAEERDWPAAEQAWVRLARLVQTPEEQREVYLRLGELYGQHAVNLARAEVAYKEVLRRTPEDTATKERLVGIYRRQNDVARAVELQQELVAAAGTPVERRERVVALASIWETTGRDLRRAEQTLETLRREQPLDVGALRALVEFHLRQGQRAPVQILLDRSAGDARRAFAAGRFSAALFEVLEAVSTLRGRTDAAAAAGAALAAFEGRRVTLRGAESRACDRRLDDTVAPELLTSAFRALLGRTGAALEAALPLDVTALDARPPEPSAVPLANVVGQLATGAGVGPVQVMISPRLGTACLAGQSAGGPVLVLGVGLVTTPNERARTFVILRALKLLQAKAAVLTRAQAGDLPVLLGAWLKAFHPTWSPEGVSPSTLAETSRRVEAGLREVRDRGDDDAVLALEAIGTVGQKLTEVAPQIAAWANRVALLGVGNVGDALEGVAWSLGATEGAPKDPAERAAWITRTPEARNLLVFATSDAHADVRAALGVAVTGNLLA